MTNTNIKHKLHEEQLRQIEEEMLPMPMTHEDQLDGYVQGGVVWKVVER
jgi:hypothetical protein